MSARRLKSLLTALLLIQVLSLPVLFAQSTTSTVKGRVVDTDGTGLPGVVVVIKSKSQPSGNKQVVTDIEGNYRIPLLPPATDYMITVDYPGFAKMEVGPLDLDAGKTTVADLTLRSSSEMTETIRVESKGNIVDTESTKTSSSYNAEFIEGLPIIGGNYQDILTLAPGVTDTDGDGNPNVHGSRDTGLQYRLDGGNITDPASGTFGQNLNPDVIEEVEVITSGASAEYGRADGGFANIITKSGGNDFEGKFSFRWRGKFLDGNGANNNDVNDFQGSYPNFTDFRPAISVGGAIVKDKLWYFGSVEILDTETPINTGNPRLRTSRGNQGLGKLTWQINSYNKLAFQINTDPRTFNGINIDLGTSPDSDFEFKQGGVVPQLKWTSTISPQLLLESLVTHFVSGIAITPVSTLFRPTEVTQVVTNNQTIQALYPCEVPNCDPEIGERRIYQIDLVKGTINGPFNFKNDDTRTRNAIKTDLNYSVEDAWGQHTIKSGIEFSDEKFNDNPINNPLLIDVTEPFQSQSTSGGTLNPLAIQGVQVVQTFRPLVTPQDASSFNSGFYILDAWKPRPNLTLNLGVRMDREDIDTSGFGFFDPRQERRQAIELWKQICAVAEQTNSVASANSNCHQFPTNYDGRPPSDTTQLIYIGDPNVTVPARVSALDINNDGYIDTQSAEGQGFYSDFTYFIERETENFNIRNTNIAPRLSISWDPWADGKTKAFGSWGRYYDRLFLNTVTGEIGPDTVNYAFRPDPTTHVISVSPRAISAVASSVSVTQIDRNLNTPYTDELTLGFERELAPEWSAGLTYIRRKGYDLLQDVDINHVTCPEYGQVLGIDPFLICGDAGVLEIDRFGNDTSTSTTSIEGGNFAFNRTASVPNGAPDLYTVNNGFNQILRIGNFNSSDYEAYELKVVKRQHRNWSMQASYTWSKAIGQAENFQSGLGNDPQTKDDEAGFLDFDERHVIKFQAVTRLQHEISIGANVQWSSGTPFSVIQTVIDQDSTGNSIFRQFFPTHQRNDQRNESQWLIDTRVDKNFVIGKVQASAFLNIQNILNDDTLRITDIDRSALNGIPLNARRNFGRRFELGAIFSF